jgi:hypothetical protein
MLLTGSRSIGFATGYELQKGDPVLDHHQHEERLEAYFPLNKRDFTCA